ncbi:MAG: hypothetical protein DYG88_14250 [Chloroflexi bacterium CFX4]|nr:hypothetical protein [Chloroflexi bacterium CFX4]MDL1923931.1 cbb3-type cytochrome c oxidase subunit I [Chloroflexi bacterium CFX3]
MPRISVWMVRTALLYLGIGFTFGALMLWNKGIPTQPSLWRLLQPHIEFLIFGWTLQLAMGVATWILPRFSQPPRYGNLALAWAAFFSLNSGVLLAAFATWQAHAFYGLLGIGRALELLAALFFVAYAWSRVKPLSTIA